MGRTERYACARRHSQSWGSAHQCPQASGTHRGQARQHRPLLFQHVRRQVGLPGVAGDWAWQGMETRAGKFLAVFTMALQAAANSYMAPCSNKRQPPPAASARRWPGRARRPRARARPACTARSPARLAGPDPPKGRVGQGRRGGTFGSPAATGSEKACEPWQGRAPRLNNNSQAPAGTCACSSRDAAARAALSVEPPGRASNRG